MTYVLAISKAWNLDLANNLQNRTSKKFLTITSPDQLTKDFLLDIKPEYIFFPHWSYIIPSPIFKAFECVIFHMTDLPFGRGGSPLQNLIANKIYETQISALRCEKEMDAGPIYLKKPLSLKTGSAQAIYENATSIIEEMIVEIIQKKIIPVPQEGEVVTFKRRTPDQSNLEELNNLNSVYDTIRMLDADNYPKAFIKTAHFKYEFSKATLHENEIVAEVRIKLHD